jgi:hypothetical protein
MSGMISRNALYDAIADLITASQPTDALYEAEISRNLRKKITESVRTVRVDVTNFRPNISTDICRKELNVGFVVQCWKMPISTLEADLEAAIDESTAMAWQIFEGIQGSDLGGNAQVVDCEEIESGDVNIATLQVGASYLTGTINPEGRRL